ncbi:hypothetical protein [Halobaculum sp. MBLA0143]|uniref:hypothetical protein n=1 Tax=Halobaculum sp. MBLA0143 TaxID=3079933 RepID=UPI003524EB00
MSHTPRPATSTRRINSYTAVVSEGQRDGITEGDRLLIEVDGRETLGTVVDTDVDDAVVELHRE